MSEVDNPVEANRKIEPPRALDIHKPRTVTQQSGAGSRSVTIRRLQRGLGNAAFARLMTARHQSAAKPRIGLAEHVVSNSLTQAVLQEPAVEDAEAAGAPALLRSVSAATAPPPPEAPEDVTDDVDDVTYEDGAAAPPPDVPDEMPDPAAGATGDAAAAPAPPPPIQPDEASDAAPPPDTDASASAPPDQPEETQGGGVIARTPAATASAPEVSIDGDQGPGTIARQGPGGIPALRGPMPGGLSGIEKIRDINKGGALNWVGPMDEYDLEEEWSKLGASGAKQYEADFMMSIKRGMEPDNLEGASDVIPKFQQAVEGLRDEYLRGNLKDLTKEETKLGINEEKPSEANEAARAQLVFMAEKAKVLDELIKSYSLIQVGYNGEQVPDKYSDQDKPGSTHLEYRPANFSPAGPPEKGLNGSEGGGAKPYAEVAASYAETMGGLMAIANKHPSIYLAVKQGQIDSLAGKDGKPPEDPTSAIKVLYANARKAIQETQADPPDWDDLKPIHTQLLKGEKNAGGIPFQDPWYREIIKAEIDWSETKETLADLGIGLAAAIAFIFSEIATGGMATVFWASAGLAIGGANVARKWDNYDELKNAAAAGTSQATELVSGDQVNAALLDAIIESAFFFFDAVGVGVKGAKGIAGMAAKRAGAEALEKAGGAALKGLSAMGKEEAVEAVEKGIKELGVQKTADAAGMSVDDLLKKVGADSAAGKQIEAFQALAKTGVEPSKLPAAIATAVKGGEVIGQNGAKMTTEEVIKQAVDTLGFQGVLKEAGSWKDLATALGGNSEVAKRFTAWRDAVYKDLAAYIETLRKADDVATEPMSKETGTLVNMTNDKDISFLGRHASENKEAATKYLAGRTGLSGDAKTLDKMVYIGLFTDPRRMHLFDEFPELQAKIAKRTMAFEEQLIWNNEYASWLIKQAEGKAGAKEMAEKIAAEMDALGVKKMPGFKPLSELTLPVLAKEQDRLHGAILDAAKAGDMTKAESLIEEMANIQAQVNVKEGGGYFSGGGVKKFVTEKEGFPGPVRAGATAAMDYQAALDQVKKLRDAIVGFEAAAVKAPLTNETKDLVKYMKDLAKYGDRFAEAASVIGKPDGSALAAIADEFSQLILMARGETVHTVQELLAKNMEGVLAKTRGAIDLFDKGHLDILKALRERAAVEGMQDLGPDIIRATKARYALRVAQEALIAQMAAAARIVGIPLQHIIREDEEGGGGTPTPSDDEQKGDFPVPNPNQNSAPA